MREAKYNFLQLYYITKTTLKKLEGDQNSSYWKEKLTDSSGIKWVMYTCMADTSSSEKICKEYYKKSNHTLNAIVDSYKSPTHFLNDWFKNIEEIKTELYKRHRQITGMTMYDDEENFSDV